MLAARRSLSLAAALLAALSLSSPALAQAPAASPATTPTPITLEQAMADPDWIGPSVDAAWWAWDGKSVQYPLKRAGSPVRDLFRQPVDGSAAQRVDDTARGGIDAADPVYDAARTRMAFVRDGNVFVRDLRSGQLTALSRSNDKSDAVRFGADGSVLYRTGSAWFRWTAAGGSGQLALLKAEKDPSAAPKDDLLRDQQLRLLASLRKDKADREALRLDADAARKADPTRAPAPVYLGADVEIADSSLSPDGRHLLVLTTAKAADAGAAGKLPKYVTESGYEEFQEVRTRVGRNDPVPMALWLVDLADGRRTPVAFGGLPGIKTDPLAALRKKAGKPALEGARAVRIESDPRGPAIRWSDDGSAVAVQVRSVDNKDRWIAGVDLAKGTLAVRDRLTDAAWIGWDYNEFGFLPNSRTLWYLSEASGYSHLYTQDGVDKGVARTSGKWEVSAPVPLQDGSGFLFLCNRAWPGDYEVCRLDFAGGKVAEVTSLDGVEDFSVSPDGRQLLVRHSRSYLPPQLSVVPVAGGAARPLTDTRTAAYRARQFVEPEIVQVPSKHGAGTVWGKFYGPAVREPGRQYPLVMFVHGAGYLQNTSARYPNYFREQLFHTLLVEKGYIVLDLDYRASQGYGRDWRTAIYRDMGTPELEDYLDGLDWAVANRQGDRAKVGIYGGSYGGFMTFMALFKQPGVFKAGAALRPVSDWTQYNHEYTANILNTPDIDPEAYLRSSPIEFADGLQDHLLIAHGMIDDNVFFRDSVVMTQKLIELHKDHWSLAPYPLERHSFTRADSWLDEYRRVMQLFDDHVK